VGENLEITSKSYLSLLVIVHEDIHRLIHATNPQIISQYISEYKETIDLRKLNELRILAGNEEISSLDNTIAG